MKFLLRRPVVIFGWIAFLAVGGGVFERRAVAEATEMKLAKARKELRALNRVSPAPTDENASMIETDLIRAQRALAAWRSELIPQSVQLDEWQKLTVPVRRTDAFFDLASAVEILRQLATENRVKTRPDERFGFSSYAHEGPEVDLIPAVFEQRRAISYLGAALMKSQPDELLTIQRENPAIVEARKKTKNATEPQSRDFFVPEGRTSLQVKDFIRARSFRISFSGGTHSLRSFLAEINSSKMPLVVRFVEAESLSLNEAETSKVPEARGENSPTADEARAVVSPVALKFTVIVELIEFAGPKTEPAMAADNPPRTS